RVFAEKCVAGLIADEARCRQLVERNVIIVTALNPHIGYDNGAKVAKEALASGKSVRQVVLDQGLMSEPDLDRALDLKRMTEGGVL
ncbi:MAG TPA: aspartate ammonia-lyase, partial [Acidimicrobiia bacterium]|nr:aspartate ammonia-lyase [Acidimicrobiia bacterium]